MENLPASFRDAGETVPTLSDQESEEGAKEEEGEHNTECGQFDLHFPEEQLAGVLKELELTLKVTSILEQEKIEELARPVETETSRCSVRQRNKRRKVKKATP